MYNIFSFIPHHFKTKSQQIAVLTCILLVLNIFNIAAGRPKDNLQLDILHSGGQQCHHILARFDINLILRIVYKPLRFHRLQC